MVFLTQVDHKVELVAVIMALMVPQVVAVQAEVEAHNQLRVQVELAFAIQEVQVADVTAAQVLDLLLLVEVQGLAQAA